MAKGVWRCLKPKAGADLRVTLDQRVTLGAIALSVIYAAIVIAVSSPVSFHTLDDPYLLLERRSDLCDAARRDCADPGVPAPTGPRHAARRDAAR